jgi:hypothetical protein
MMNVSPALNFPGLFFRVHPQQQEVYLFISTTPQNFSMFFPVHIDG